MAQTAVVVGAASNIGYQVLKQLCDVYEGKIYFTTEEYDVGKNVYDNLNKSGHRIEYRQMDVTDVASIVAFRHHIQDNDERVDLIINNTEYVPPAKKLKNAERVRRALNVNFYGNLNFGKLLYPLLNEHGRVVNVSGPAGLLSTIENEVIRNNISNPNLSEEELVALMIEYEEAAKKGIEKTEGWGASVRAVSKVALNALTFLQHRQWSNKGIVINCVNPGDLQSKEGRKSSKAFENGAKAILYLALEAPLSLKGNFVWSNYSVIEWNCDPYVEVTTV